MPKIVARIFNIQCHSSDTCGIEILIKNRKRTIMELIETLKKTFLVNSTIDYIRNEGLYHSLTTVIKYVNILIKINHEDHNCVIILVCS